MPNLSEVFAAMCQRAGVKIDNPELVAIISNPELTKIPVPDSLKTSMESGLHTLESARSVLKKEVEGTVRAEAYNGMDAELFGLAPEFGLPDEFVDSLKSKEIKTSARFKAIASKIKELSSQTAGATGKEKTDLVEQINTLKLEQGKLVKSHQDAIAAVKLEAENEINDMAIDGHIGKYKFATDDGTPEDFKALYVKTELKKKLLELGAVAKFDKSAGKIILTKADGTGVFDTSNNPIDFKGITDGIVAEKKLIQISKGSQGSNAGGQGSQGSGGSGGNGQDTSSFDNFLAQSIKDHQNA